MIATFSLIDRLPRAAADCQENLLLHPDFRDMLSALNAEHVEFLLVGAYALAAHGLPCATDDMDIWIRCSDENAQRVWCDLQCFGAPLTDVTLDDLNSLLQCSHTWFAAA